MNKMRNLGYPQQLTYHIPYFKLHYTNTAIHSVISYFTRSTEDNLTID